MDILQGTPIIHSCSIQLLPGNDLLAGPFFLDQDWISDSVDIRQLLIETHRLPTEELGVHPADFFDDIEKAGFAMFSKEPNIHPIVAGRCVEWGFVKLRKEFFGDRVAH
jgi:Methyltransferase domain